MTGRWRARVRRAGRIASGAAIAFAAVVALNLTATAADLRLGGNFVSSAATFNATMAQSAGNITITVGTQTVLDF
jgi:hypothetical protein